MYKKARKSYCVQFSDSLNIFFIFALYPFPSIVSLLCYGLICLLLVNFHYFKTRRRPYVFSFRKQLDNDRYISEMKWNNFLIWNWNEIIYLNWSSSTFTQVSDSEWKGYSQANCGFAGFAYLSEHYIVESRHASFLTLFWYMYGSQTSNPWREQEVWTQGWIE